MIDSGPGSVFTIVRMRKLAVFLLLCAVFVKLYPLGFVAPVTGGKVLLQLDLCHARDAGSPGGTVAIPAGAMAGFMLVFLCFFSQIQFLLWAAIIPSQKMKPPRHTQAGFFLKN